MEQLQSWNVGLGLVGHRLLRRRNRKTRIRPRADRQRRSHQFLLGRIEFLI